MSLLEWKWSPIWMPYLALHNQIALLFGINRPLKELIKCRKPSFRKKGTFDVVYGTPLPRIDFLLIG